MKHNTGTLTNAMPRARAAVRSPNVQQDWLRSAIGKRVRVDMLTPELSIVGVLRAFDQYTLEVAPVGQSATMLLYKQAIVSISLD